MNDDVQILKKYDKMVLFFVLYTVFFFSFLKTLDYTIPFVLAFAVSVVLVRPLRWLRRKTGRNINSTVLVAFSTVLFYGTIGTLLVLLVIRLIAQLTQLIMNMADYLNDHYEEIFAWLQRQYEWVILNMQALDESLIESGNELIQELISSFRDFFMRAASVAGSVAWASLSNVPFLFLVIVFTVILTYFLSKKMLEDPGFLYKYIPASDDQKVRIRSIFVEGKTMLVRYSLSYLLIIGITGLISLVVYIILGIPYALLFALITAVFDLLPILGVGGVYVPLALYYFAQGNYTIPIWLGILWAVISVGRNIWEPKIVSSSLDINPIATIAAIFIGLRLSGLVGMFYLISMMVCFKVLQKVGVLDTFT